MRPKAVTDSGAVRWVGSDAVSIFMVRNFNSVKVFWLQPRRGCRNRGAPVLRSSKMKSTKKRGANNNRPANPKNKSKNLITRKLPEPKILTFEIFVNYNTQIILQHK